MRYALLACLFLLMAIVPASNRAAPGPPPGPPAARWKKIDQLLAKNQTATAAPLVEAIYQEAQKANDAPAYVRALLYKIRLLDAKQLDADERAIALLEADLKTAGFPARPILHSLLAELYVNYLNQNRYRLYNRTAGAEATAGDSTAASAGADGGSALPTWDVAHLGSAIVRHYRQSVEIQPEKQLATSLVELGDLAAGGDAEGRALRPTLYDLLAHRAIEGLRNQELYITRPEQQFEATDPKLYGPAQAFAGLRLEASAADSLNGQLQALRLLQRLTAARVAVAPPNPAALADVDLARLDYLHGLGQEEASTIAYAQALISMGAAYAALPIGTEFAARRAELLQDTDPAAALKMARAAEGAFPKSRGAARAQRLREQIERPELAFEAAQMVVPGQSWRLALTTRNLTQLHAWAYPVSLVDMQAFERQGTDARDRRYARLVRQAPAATWTVPLPAPSAPYRRQQTTVAGPALPVGYYLLVLSNRAERPTKATAGAVVQFGLLGASELTAVSRAGAEEGGAELLVLHRQSGVLLPGTRVQARFERYEAGRDHPLVRLTPVQQTDAAGRVTLPPASNRFEQLAWVKLWRGADTLLREGIGSYGRRGQAEPLMGQRRAFLFTDRAIYRPGQTLYFKGIVTENTDSRAQVMPGKAVSVRLLDVNGQTVQTLTFTTSEFGSFHGSLLLPTGLLNGEMSLQTDQGNVSFQVEDYKRPTFLVLLDSVPGRPQLGQPLAISGRARAYAGQATDGATVRYRVTRRALWPLFDYYDGLGGGRSIYPPGGRGGSQEIAHGTTTTDAEGRFVFSFVPPVLPKASGARWEPGYLFEVTADVTDAAGETRTSTRSLIIGRNPLSLRLEGPEMLDRQRPESFRLSSLNATGEPLPAAGTLRLLARRYRPNPPGLSGPPEISADNELPAELLKTLPFDTKNGLALDLKALLAGLPTGLYRLEAQAAAPDTAARARHDFTLFDAQASTVPFATPHWFKVLADSVAPGQPATVLLGSSVAGARILLEVERGGELLRSEWLTLAAGEQRRLSIESGPVTARGSLHIHATQVLNNQLFASEATVQVAEKAQPLQLSLSTFRDRLQPGQRETWRLTIRQANGQPADAELLATLYDQSLDVFRPHGLAEITFGNDYYPAWFAWQGQFNNVQGRSIFEENPGRYVAPVDYPLLATWGALNGNQVVTGFGGGGRVRRALKGVAMGVRAESRMDEVVVTNMRVAPMSDAAAGYSVAVAEQQASTTAAPAPPPPPPANLAFIPARSDFRETALWEPALRTDKDGNAVLEFQMPEAVTRWQLLLLAHDKALHTGRLARQLVTQKAIQITPNAPRFFRQGDTFTFPAKFSNLTDRATSGTAQLTVLDAATGQDITGQLLKGAAQQSVSAAAHQSAALGWEISLPADFAPVAITYKVVVQTGGNATEKPSAKNQKRETSSKQQETYLDGESNTLPVLPNKILVTESLPLPIVGPGTRTFELKKLTSTRSPTRRNYALTLEATDNPAWYAVQSLPYLTEYPYECSEQVFSRLYANLLAAHILRSNPRLKTVLAEWQRQAQSGTPAQRNALESKLAQNQELKSLLLQETPWVRDAQGETERLARLVTLFDAPRLEGETARSLAQLQAMQQSGGAFPWFERMPDDRYITQLIVAGFGKLKKLGAFDASQDEKGRVILRNALRYLDESLARDLAELRRQKDPKLTDDHLGDLQIQALYARSFWGPLPERTPGTAAFVFYSGQAARYWPSRTRYLQAQLALALFRVDNKAIAAQEIMRGLAENALHSPELGMYWKDVQPGYYWREAPTETQATLIEAFSEVKNDQKSVDEMKLWLLQQKQVQHWESTRATADACYALLLRGGNWLAPAQPLQLTVGGETPQFDPGQAGTGYRKISWPAAAITPAQGKATLTKTDAGPAWGALHWQYFEDIDKVTPAATPLSLERQLYRETRTADGPQLEKLTPAAPLRVGDVLVVRLVLRTDRALEYVHLKDQRAAGLEISQPLSGYRYQNGLGYYESPRDAATNFFLSEVPRGTHVFEYRLRASQAGDFSGGLSQVQCLYAPEFSAHSAGSRLTIGR